MHIRLAERLRLEFSSSDTKIKMLTRAPDLEKSAISLPCFGDERQLPKQNFLYFLEKVQERGKEVTRFQ